MLSFCPRQALLTHSSSGHAEMARAAPPSGRRGRAPAPTLFLPPRWTERGGPTWSEPRLAAAPAAGGSCLQNPGAKPAMGRQAEQHPEKSGPCKAGLPPEPAPTTLDVLPTGDESSRPRRNPHTGAYCSSSHNCRKLDPSGSPLAGEWIRTLWSIQRVE